MQQLKQENLLQRVFTQKQNKKALYPTKKKNQTFISSTFYGRVLENNISPCKLPVDTNHCLKLVLSVVPLLRLQEDLPKIETC